MNLSDALNLTKTDLVALVGGGGKTTAMFRLAEEIAANGGQALLTTTTRIFATQIDLAPTYVLASKATPKNIKAQLKEYQQVLVIGEVENTGGKAVGVSVEFVAQLRRNFPTVPMVIEADGSRMRPFKAPAEHEPVIPLETTHVVVVVGADALGKPLTAENVHRAEIVSQLSGAPLGTSLTAAIIAHTLTHPAGGLKNVPANAQVSVLINKVDLLDNWVGVKDLERRLLANPSITRVVWATLKTGETLRVSHNK